MQASELNRWMDQVLRIERVTKFFGGLQVLDHVDITVGRRKLGHESRPTGVWKVPGKAHLKNEFIGQESTVVRAGALRGQTRGRQTEEDNMEFRIAVLPGDGVGPEVTTEAVKVLEAIEAKSDHNFIFRERHDWCRGL